MTQHLKALRLWPSKKLSVLVFPRDGLAIFSATPPSHPAKCGTLGASHIRKTIGEEKVLVEHLAHGDPTARSTHFAAVVNAALGA